MIASRSLHGSKPDSFNLPRTIEDFNTHGSPGIDSIDIVTIVNVASGYKTCIREISPA